MFKTSPSKQKENKNEVREKGVDSSIGREERVDEKMTNEIEELKIK